MTLAEQNDNQRPADGAAPGGRAVPGARTALVLLLLINLFNYIDRQVLAAVEPRVQESLLPGDPNAGAKMGLLWTGFLVTYMLMAPVFGLLAERWSRWLLIGVGVILWSLASGASGLAAGFGIMLITRCFVGVGEAAYGPAAPALIADLYPVARRGRVLSWFYMAIPVGSALGYILGAQVAAWDRAAESWRWAFYLVVVPGILLGIWALVMRDPPRGAADPLAAPPRRATWRDYLVLLRTTSYVLNTGGMTAMTFAIGAIGYWMPRYLESHGVQSVWGVHPTAVLGAMTALAGLLGTLAGGVAGDLLRPKFPGSYFLVSGVGLLITVPCVLLVVRLPFPLAWVFVFLALFFLFFNTGPSNTILANVAHPSMRATGYAMNILVIHLFGDAVSPTIVGAIADRSSLGHGFVVVSVLLLAGGIVWLCGARYLARDTEAALHRLD